MILITFIIHIKRDRSITPNTRGRGVGGVITYSINFCSWLVTVTSVIAEMLKLDAFVDRVHAVSSLTSIWRFMSHCTVLCVFISYAQTYCQSTIPHTRLDPTVPEPTREFSLGWGRNWQTKSDNRGRSGDEEREFGTSWHAADLLAQQAPQLPVWHRV